MSIFTHQEILDQLDRYAGKEEYQFPILDHGYYYPIGARMSAFRDQQCWAIIYEALGYNPRSDGHAVLAIHPFGNCLKSQSTPHEADFPNATSDGPEGPTFIEPEGTFWLSSDAKTIRVRDQLVPVEHDLAVYGRHGVPL